MNEIIRTMTLIEFIRYYDLRGADAIVLRKKFLGMFDHFVIFIGFRANQPVFVANYKDGIKEVSPREMSYYLQNLQPEKIEYFEGDEIERKYAVRRAISRIGESAYGFFSNNCEHFKNWVHHGENKSKQVNTAGNISLGVGTGLVLTGAVAKSGAAAGWGLGLILVGLLLKGASETN